MYLNTYVHFRNEEIKRLEFCIYYVSFSKCKYIYTYILFFLKLIALRLYRLSLIRYY